MRDGVGERNASRIQRISFEYILFKSIFKYTLFYSIFFFREFCTMINLKQQEAEAEAEAAAAAAAGHH